MSEVQGYDPTGIIVVIIVVVLIIATAIVLKKKRKEHIIIREETTKKEVIIKIRCRYCQGVYDETLDKCPHCGAKRS